MGSRSPPSEGGAYRGEQLVVGPSAHERVAGTAMSDPCQGRGGFGDLDPLGMTRSTSRIRRTHERKRLLPVELVEEEARLQSDQAIWAKARGASDFGQFAPVLERIVDLLAAKQSAMASRTVESLGMRWPKTTNPVVRPKKLTLFLVLSNFGSGNWWPTSRPRTNHPATPSTELFLIGRPRKLLCVVWRRDWL